MPKQKALLRGLAVAALFAALAWPGSPVAGISAAQASPRADSAMHAKKHARIHHPMRRQFAGSRNYYNSARNGPDCTWPYKRMLPPCMSTWPEGDPNYHGTLRGNQFE